MRCTMVNRGVDATCCVCGGVRPPEALPFAERARLLRADGCELPKGLAADNSGHSGGFTAHTILMLDNSGSMRLKDVMGEASALERRCDALLHVLQKDLIEKQLAEGATSSDRISLIKMQALEASEDVRVGGVGACIADLE